MTLIKTSILTAISTIIKVISGFLITKIVAVHLGPSGLAIIGQLQNFVNMVSNLSNGAITKGIIKYTADSHTIKEKQSLFSTSLKISVLTGFIISLFLGLFSKYIALELFGNSDLQSVIYVFSVSIIFYSLNTLLMSILNGQKEIKKYILSNISNSLVSLFLIIFLTISIGLEGALYGLVTSQSIVFFVTLFFVAKSEWFSLEYFNQEFNLKIAKKLSHYSFMAAISIIFSIGSILYVRSYIGNNISWDNAGYWQGIMYISDAYLLIVTMSLSVYYLPRLSEIDNNTELLMEVLNGYKFILPFIILIALLVFVSKSYIVDILFTESFYPMIELFKWQLIGDVIKISAWLLSYVFLAKAMTKLFVYTEILFSILFVILSILAIEQFGLIGVTYAFTLNYIFYLITMIILYNRNFK
ncbi:MAG: Polysaccharide biosynthesis protein [uncultured Sulfurovum sp.]|uniref:Polysaccharide biosynthesis protein n=1 Tax=uncultured Sulfurovum sp. TaxID=269237 RepID=A0A6S6T7T0_9BACT|nr:MAG: Polysaccharide biosynthesis protein [uncultured Sulfurovum sp.]